jgi:hypothetical protein
VRTYSNGTPGKDIILDNGQLFLYRLKDEPVRAQFEVNIQCKKLVRVFCKVATGVIELGEFMVTGFVPAGIDDQIEKFGAIFVKMVKVDHNV